MSPTTEIDLAVRGLVIGSTEHVIRVLQGSDLRTMNDIFSNIFRVFLLLGTLVGVVVIGYMVYNAYKYRETAGESQEAEYESDIARPQLGELPSGGGDGKKLAVSFAISAIIVISLIVWTYTLLKDVEAGPADPEEQIEVQVEGYQFGWQYIYPNGHTTNTLRVPEGEAVTLTVTSRDVFHNFGIPAFDLKTDAIPGQTTETWFQPSETGTYQAKCFELCGQGHSLMETKVVVMEPEKYDRWYANTGGNNTSAATSNTTSNATSTTTTGASTSSSNALADITRGPQ